MVVLEHLPLIFLKPRKVGGTSLEIALSRYASPDSIITPISSVDEKIRSSLGFRGPQNYLLRPDQWIKYPKRDLARFLYKFQRPRRFWNHITALEVSKRLDAALWHSALKVSIVRNPFDMVVSKFFWANRNRGAAILTKQDFIHYVNTCPNLNINIRQYFIGNVNVIDFFIRFEYFETDLLFLEHNFPQLNGIRHTFAQLKAKSSHRPKNISAAELFHGASEAISKVERACKFEIDRFGYECPK